MIDATIIMDTCLERLSHIYNIKSSELLIYASNKRGKWCFFSRSRTSRRISSFQLTNTEYLTVHVRVHETYATQLSLKTLKYQLMYAYAIQPVVPGGIASMTWSARLCGEVPRMVVARAILSHARFSTVKSR